MVCLEPPTGDKYRYLRSVSPETLQHTQDKVWHRHWHLEYAAKHLDGYPSKTNGPCCLTCSQCRSAQHRISHWLKCHTHWFPWWPCQTTVDEVCLNQFLGRGCIHLPCVFSSFFFLTCLSAHNVVTQKIQNDTIKRSCLSLSEFRHDPNTPLWNLIWSYVNWWPHIGPNVRSHQLFSGWQKQDSLIQINWQPVAAALSQDS